jgi:sigma-B regulation protein RsbU (phosphoserine phosphatase)
MLRLTTSPADLGRVYPWLDEAATGDALPEAFLARLHVALEEAVANIAMHAQTDSFTLEYLADVSKVSLVVTDDGLPFDPRLAPVPAPAESLEAVRAGGKGLILLRHFCKDLEYQRVDGVNKLIMRFER